MESVDVTATGKAADVMATDSDPRIHSLAGMARALGRSHPLLELLEIAAEEARDAVQAATVSISRLEAGTGFLRTLINVGDLGPDEVRWPADEVYSIRPGSNLGLVVDELQTWTVSIADPHCAVFERELLEQLEKGSSLGAPLMVDGQLWGELYATRHVGQAPFSNAEGAYVEALTAILAGAVSRWAREESLELLAFRDPLTGLLNRRALDHQAAQAFNIPDGASRTVTVIAMDINRLKHVNDTLGHGAGDRLIQSVTRSMLKTFGRLPGSLVARVGGDEFTALVSGHAPVTVVEAADTLCQQRYERGAGISAGAASVVLTHGCGITAGEIFAAADRAQYDAKRRNLTRTVISADFPGPQ